MTSGLRGERVFVKELARLTNVSSSVQCPRGGDLAAGCIIKPSQIFSPNIPKPYFFFLIFTFSGSFETLWLFLDHLLAISGCCEYMNRA